MKQLFTLLLGLIALPTFAQNFALPGAEWKYSYYSFMGMQGYTQISVAGDTLIGTISAKKLEKRLIGVDQITLQPINDVQVPDYVYENAGLVYIYHNTHWDTLYNFNAVAGDYWKIAKNPVTSACDTNSFITVTGGGTRSINGINLNYQLVNITYMNDVDNLIQADTIYQRMGLVSSYMLTFDN